MRDLDVRRDGVEQQGPVAVRRLALEAQQGARLVLGQSEHLRALGDRFGELELSGIDALEVGMASCASGRPALGRPTKCVQVHLFDAGFLERGPERGL